MRSLVKRFLFATGIARLLHRLHNRRVLTVVMFHRVLPLEDPRAAGANPTYTVTADEFAACLAFFARWYTVVDLAMVERAAAGGKLPACPLLITFDDGWRDNVEYALPLLAARGMPAVLFVATDHVGSRMGFWQERVFDAAKRAGGSDIVAAAEVAVMAAASPERRSSALETLPDPDLPRQMADAVELAQMQASGVTIGGHGHSHTPLTDVPDAAAELATCRSVLKAAGLGGALPALSFPHGRCNQALIRCAQQEGFGLCFTSEPCLTAPEQLADPRGIGRVSVELRYLRRQGGFDLPSLAFSLLTRPRRAAA